MNDPVSTAGPALGTTPVESVIARHTVARVLWVGPLIVGAFTILRGFDGFVGSTVGVLAVAANFLFAGLMLSVALKISLAMYQAAALFGFLLRMGLLIGTMLLVVGLFDVDRVAFGISAVVAYIVLLILESVAVARGRERDLDWTS